MSPEPRPHTLVLRDEGHRLVEISATEATQGLLPPLRALVEKVASRPSAAWYPMPPSLGMFHLLAHLDYAPLRQMRALVRSEGEWREVRALISLRELQRMFPGPNQTLEFELGASFVVKGTRPAALHAAPGVPLRDEWMFEDDPGARRRMSVMGEASLPHGIVFERGPDAPQVRLLQPVSEFTRAEMRFDRPAPTSSRGFSDPPMSIEMLEELVRVRMICGALNHGVARPAEGSVPAIRLARWIHDAITGQTSRPLKPTDDGSMAEERLEAWAGAWSAPWRIRLPRVVHAMAKVLPDGVRLVWNSRGVQLERKLPNRRPPRAQAVAGAASSPLAWTTCSLLGPEAEPILALVRSSALRSPDGAPREPQSEEEADLQFMSKLIGAGGTLSATSEFHQGIQIQRKELNRLRFMIQIPEHLAGTGQIGAKGERLYAQWPATELGVQFDSTTAVSASGKLPSFRYWDRRFNLHPLCSSSALRPNDAGGSVCIASSGEHAATQAARHGLTPGQVAAAQMIELRDTFMMGIRGGNPNGYYREGYGSLVWSGDKENRPFKILPEKEARAVATHRRISINDY